MIVSIGGDALITRHRADSGHAVTHAVASVTMTFHIPQARAMPKSKSKSKEKKIEARLSPIHGNGVFATEAIKKGERIVRYKGKLRTHEEVDEEYGDEDENGHTFLFTLNDDYVIDANVDGNIARWINHSCKPNCESEIEENAKGKRHKDKVFIHALRDIKPGEELTYNYGIVLDEPHTAKVKKLWACKCGAKNCTGTMLQPKR
jgi:SET domain-containing protein